MQRTDISGSPFFDDYDSEKGFHRILFKPRPVQARELNQIQSIMMSQIERLGNHLFKEGSMVIPGGLRILSPQSFVSIDFASGFSILDIIDREELIITSSMSGLIAKVSKIIPSEGLDKTKLFVDFTNSGSNQEKKFSSSESCVISEIVDGIETQIANVTVAEIGNGIWAKVQNGVYFVRGMLVQTPDQDYVVSKYSVDGVSAKIGFKVTEELIDETDDSSLYSNALGYPNFMAPGAERLKVNLELTSIGLNDTDLDFIELARIENGLIQVLVDQTNYNIIERSIAQRTYETNGNYTVSPFGIEIKEHLQDGNNGGVYPPEDGGLEEKLVASIKPGIGYIKGYRVENIGIVNLEVDKARDTNIINNSVTSSDYGPYILLETLESLPDIDIRKKITLIDILGETIGYCRIRAIRKDGDLFRAFIFDVNMNLGKAFSNTKSIRYTDSSNLFDADLASSKLFNSNRTNMFFKLPVSAVQTLLDDQGATDTSYTVTRSFTATTDSNGVATVAVGLNESFAPVDSNNYFVADTGPANAGVQYDVSTSVVLSGDPIGSSITIDLSSANADKTIKIIAPVVKLSSIQKTKTLTTITDEAITFTDESKKNLTKSDVVSILSIKDSETLEEIKNSFILDNGQRPAWYQVGAIETSDKSKVTKSVLVTYTYFEHSTGDYFSSDSYTGMDRDDIPKYDDINLADVIDFRPRKDINGDITTSTFNGELVRPNDTIRADITYYLPRRDIIYVDENGNFVVKKGISSSRPTSPITPDNAMKLYDLYIPAFTSSNLDVNISYIDNKRYTMRDIGKLENRIKNVEYYTTLSALEAKTNSTQIIDPVTGNNRFKNGFAVDGFSDFRLADINDPEWSASIDINSMELKPSFMENGSDYTHSSLDGVVKPGNVYMRSYTESPVVVQPYATKTINVNPFAVFTWIGKISLTPSSDFWKDVKYLAPIIINNVQNLRGNAVQGTVWSTWQGVDVQISTVQSGWNVDQFRTTTTTTVSTGTTTTFTESNSSRSTDNFVNNVVIPFMRSIDIKFKCEKFKPYTQIYPFWDGVDVSDDCKPDGGDYGDPIVTDEAGLVSGTFTVPNREDKKFRTGTSSMRFTDSPTDYRGMGEGAPSSAGEAVFTSGGSVDNRQLTVVNTKTLGFTTSNTTQTSTSSTVVRTGTWSNDPNLMGGADPIAQTFRIPLSGGGFITKVDVFFATKAEAIPVTMELRTVSTGLPTSFVIASKILNPSDVNVSDDGSLSTSFVFDDPVYLEEQVEYSIVILAETQEYTVYIAELGENVIGEEMALAKQPNLGVFLTSSNGSTWNPNQTQDLKFTIHRAVFDTASSGGQVLFNGTDPIALPVTFNAISTTEDSNAIEIYMKSHGLKAGDKVTLSGVVGGNGILASSLNGVEKTVTESDIDRFTITTTETATATGTFGGTDIKVKANYPFTTFLSNIEFVDFNRTSTVWEYRYKQQSNRAFSGWIQFNPKTTISLNTEGVMISGSDFQIRATVRTEIDNLSPCIDSSGLTTVFVSPRINNDIENPVYTYMTEDIMFDNPSTSFVYYIGAKLPNGSDMKVYYKLFDTADEDLTVKPWIEAQPTNPISNDMTRFVEYTYELGDVGTFVGYKVKVVLLGTDPVSYPSLSDFRSIALA